AAAAATRTSHDPTTALWLTRLGSALRTTLACTIVGCTTLYCPASLRHLLAYPAFSYVTTLLIVSDATLGGTLRGCCHALYASVQVIIPSMLILGVIGPARFTNGLAAVAVAVSAFLVALPESTPLLAKRIAFGQIVIVYVGTVIHGAQTGVVMHPVHVASSTALGAFASVLAMLLPYPRLAYHEIKKTCRLYVENASERLNLFTEALTAQGIQAATHLISQARFLSKIGAKHLQSIKDGQGCMMWEKPHMQFAQPNSTNPGGNMQDMEIAIRGMELALTSCRSFPLRLIDGGLKEEIRSLKDKVALKLEHAKCLTRFDATTAPEMREELPHNFTLNPQTSATSRENLPAFFFLYCMEFLRGESHISRTPNGVAGIMEKTETGGASGTKAKGKQGLGRFCSGMITKVLMEKWIFATKCSLSLGFAVLFGLMFNKENGYWSGLTIAISFITGRQPTFTVANARAQGTAIGSVYGIIGCFIFGRIPQFRFLFLLPWIIFTSFLRHSRMYGQAGGLSAVIGASLILGRKGYGPPSEFAIARLAEACIGLSCFIVVEILLQPARAAALAKAELERSLGALQACINDIVIYAGQKSMPSSIPLALREKQKLLKSHIDELEKFISEAELEPNFWFLPFPGACYGKFLRSLRKTEDILLFGASVIHSLSQASESLGIGWDEVQEHVYGDLGLFQEKIGFALKSLQEVLKMKSIATHENKWRKENLSLDIELGKSADAVLYRNLGPEEEEIWEVERYFLEHSKEVANKINNYNGDQQLKNQIIMYLSSLVFCISSLLRETTEIEKEVREIIAWENPTRHINLYELSSQMEALNRK
ncbi:hypothetical protein Tsubulata_018691, partial [Turnera subulata]